MTHTKAKRIGRTKGKTRVLKSRKLSRSREFYRHREANRVVGIVCRHMRVRKGAGGDPTKLKFTMNIDCSTGVARWDDGAPAL